MSNLGSHPLGTWPDVTLRASLGLRQGPQPSTLAFRSASMSALHRLGKIGEEFVRQFLGRSVDQALSELGQFAADLRLDIIAQQGAAILFGEAHGRAALGE